MPKSARPPVFRPAVETREPKSIRFSPSLWEEIESWGRMFGKEATTFARECVITGLRLKQVDAFSLSDRRGTA